MKWKKFTFTTILGIIIILASFFMITESARYYTFFYESGAWQPLFLASLLEIFVLALAVMKIGTKKVFNFIQKIIMISVFIVIIAAAGIQAVNPTLENLEATAQQSALSDILKEEYKTLQKDRDVFEKQKQKRNTAIAAAERRKIVSDLKSLFNQDVKTDKGRVALINILLLFTIRFIVQLSNVYCASMLGVYFRYKNNTKEKRTMKWNIFKRFKKEKKIEEVVVPVKKKVDKPVRPVKKKVDKPVRPVKKKVESAEQVVLRAIPNAVCKKVVLRNKTRFKIYTDSTPEARIIAAGQSRELAWKSVKQKHMKGK